MVVVVVVCIEYRSTFSGTGEGKCWVQTEQSVRYEDCNGSLKGGTSVQWNRSWELGIRLQRFECITGVGGVL